MHGAHKRTGWMHKQAEAVKLNGIAQSLPPPIPPSFSLALSLSKPPNHSPPFSSSEEFINCLSTETLWKSGSYKGREGERERERGREGREGWWWWWMGLYYPIRWWICLVSLPCHEKNINFKWGREGERGKDWERERGEERGGGGLRGRWWGSLTLLFYRAEMESPLAPFTLAMRIEALSMNAI